MSKNELPSLTSDQLDLSLAEIYDLLSPADTTKTLEAAGYDFDRTKGYTPNRNLGQPMGGFTNAGESLSGRAALIDVNPKRAIDMGSIIAPYERYHEVNDQTVAVRGLAIWRKPEAN